MASYWLLISSGVQRPWLSLPGVQKNMRPLLLFDACCSLDFFIFFPGAGFYSLVVRVYLFVPVATTLLVGILPYTGI